MDVLFSFPSEIRPSFVHSIFWELCTAITISLISESAVAPNIILYNSLTYPFKKKQLPDLGRVHVKDGYNILVISR